MEPVPLSERHRYRYGVDTVAVGFLLDGLDDSFDGWKTQAINGWTPRRDGMERPIHKWRYTARGIHGPGSRAVVSVTQFGVLLSGFVFARGRWAGLP